MPFGVLKGKLPQAWDPAQGPVPFSFGAMGENEGTPASPPVTSPMYLHQQTGATRVRQLYDQNKQPITGLMIPMFNNAAGGYADLDMTLPGGVGLAMEAYLIDEAGVVHGGMTNTCIFPPAPPTAPTSKVVQITSPDGSKGGPVTVPFTITVDGVSVYQSVNPNPVKPQAGSWGSW